MSRVEEIKLQHNDEAYELKKEWWLSSIKPWGGVRTIDDDHNFAVYTTAENYTEQKRKLFDAARKHLRVEITRLRRLEESLDLAWMEDDE